MIKKTKTELRQDAMDYMGWTDEDNMGELYTPTREDMVNHLVEFVADYLEVEPDTPIVFNTKVRRKEDGMILRIAMDKTNGDGMYVASQPGHAVMVWMRRNEFTIEEDQA